MGRRSIQLRFLIVCEGLKTEPNYFAALMAHNRLSHVISVEIEGEGKGTSTLVRRAWDLALRRGADYDRVWVVFDKDDFPDFDEAIDLSERLGFGAAWSNESFELWYLLHFYTPSKRINRHQYISGLERRLRVVLENTHYRYSKGAKDMYSILCAYGSQRKAMDRASSLRDLYRGLSPALSRPCTTVDRLVRELNHPERVPLGLHVSRAQEGEQVEVSMPKPEARASARRRVGTRSLRQ